MRNSVSPHNSNTFAPLTPSQLIQVLCKHKKKIAAVLYVQRTGSVDTFRVVKKAGFRIINFRRNLLHKHQRRNADTCRNLKQSHPVTNPELGFAATALLCEDDLTGAPQKNKHRNKKGPKRGSETKQS